MRQLALVSLLFASVVQAQVFRWTDKDGVVHYADKPLVPEARPAVLPPLQTYQADAPPPVVAPAASGIRISAPAAGSTLRDADGSFTIEVAATPAPGQGLIYYLDGVQQNKMPTPSTALLLNAVKGGTHTLSAALVDAGGRELARAAPVAIRVSPAAARH